MLEALASPLTGRGLRRRVSAEAPVVTDTDWAPSDTADWLAVKAAVTAAGATAHLWTGEPGSLSTAADGAGAVWQGGPVRGIRDHFAPADLARRLRVWTPGSEAEHGGTRVQASGLDMVDLASEPWPSTAPWRGFAAPALAAPEGHIFWLLDATTISGLEECFLQTVPFRVVKSNESNEIAIRGDGANRYPMLQGFSGRTFLELRWSLPGTVRWRILNGDWATISGVAFAARTEYLYGLSSYDPFNYQPAPHRLGAFLYVDKVLPDAALQPFRDLVLAGSGLTDSGPSAPPAPGGGGGGNEGTIGDPLRVVNVTTAAQLAAALNAALPGDHIVLANGTYSGTFGTTKAGTSGQPIVIKALNDRVPVINGRIVLNNPFNTVYALSFSSAQTDGNITIDADDCRALRCNMPAIGARGIKVLRNQRKRFEIAYNYIEGGANPIQIQITPGGTQALNGHVHHNHLKGCSGSSIEMGTNENHSAVPVEMLVEYNLIEECGDNTALGFKCSSSVMHRNTLLNCGNANLQSRSGRNNRFIANACIGSGGCLLRGDGHLAIGNYKDDTFTGSWNDHTSPAGTIRQAQFEQSGFTGTQWPAGDNTLWIGNIPHVRIGGGSSTATVVALNNRVEASPATLVAGKHSGTTTSPMPSQEVPIYIVLNAGMTGFAATPAGPPYGVASAPAVAALAARPFNDGSGFNIPMGTGAVYSKPAVFSSYTAGTIADDNVFSNQAHIATGAEPVANFTWSGSLSGVGLPFSVHFPATGFPTFETVTQYDCVATVITPDGLIHDIYRIDTRNGARLAAIHRTHPLTGLGHGTGTGWERRVGASAAGNVVFAGTVRKTEFETDGQVIGHAHHIAVPFEWLNRQFQAPAVCHDGFSATNNPAAPLKMGARLAFRPADTSAITAEINALAISASFKDTLLRYSAAFRDYGLIVTDSAGQGSFRADGVLNASRKATFVSFMRTIMWRYLYLVTNAVDNANATVSGTAQAPVISGSAGTMRIPIGGGTPIAPNLALVAA